MSRNDKPGIVAGVAAQIYVGLIVWIALMAAKALGAPFGVSWRVLGFGVVYIPLTFAILLLAILALQSAARSIHRSIRLHVKRLHIKREIRKIIQNFTLNGVGEFFNVKRIPGETNTDYMKRISTSANKISPVALDMMLKAEKYFAQIGRAHV